MTATHRIDPLSLEEMIALARSSLPLWGLNARTGLSLLNLAENVTLLVSAGSSQYVLRIHRQGYHSRAEIESELAWMAALQAGDVIAVPRALPRANGARVQSLAPDLFAVLFEHLPGAAPEETGDLTPGFAELGSLAAACHDHVTRWPLPPGFTRKAWDLPAVFGPDAPWGDWRAAPGVTAGIATMLEQAERRVKERLSAFGQTPDRYGLIHADMRLANLLVHEGRTRVIDFDDCGFGWFLYDYAAAISFLELDPREPDWRAAWLKGYRAKRALSAEMEAMIDDLVLFRRFALLAWIGSHMEAPEPQALAPHFAAGTAELAARYLG